MFAAHPAPPERKFFWVPSYKHLAALRTGSTPAKKQHTIPPPLILECLKLNQYPHGLLPFAGRANRRACRDTGAISGA